MDDMDVTALVLAIVAMLLSMAALGVAASVRHRRHVEPWNLARYQDYPYWPPDGRTGPFPGPSEPQRPPWEGGPRT